MNQTFSFHRFGLLLRLHLSEHLKSYLLQIGVLLGIWTLLLMPDATKLDVFTESIYRKHGLFFCFIFCATGAWFASDAFRAVSTPLRGIPYLTLPASQLEKFLVAFLMLLCFFPVFTGAFYAVEGIVFSIINARLPVNSTHYGLLDLTNERYADPVMLYVTVITPAVFLLGSIYFPKQPFVVTAVIAFVLFFILELFLNDFIGRRLFPSQEYMGATPFREVGLLKNGRWYWVQLKGIPHLLVNGILFLIIPALWFITYVRFKEKEL